MAKFLQILGWGVSARERGGQCGGSSSTFQGGCARGQPLRAGSCCGSSCTAEGIRMHSGLHRLQGCGGWGVGFSS